jgi:DNA-binding NtrC family response regulator
MIASTLHPSESARSKPPIDKLPVSDRLQPLVLVVDDDAAWRDLVALRLRRSGRGACTASNVVEAVAAFERERIDVVVTDHRMPGGSGLDLLAYLHGRRPDLPVVVMSAVVTDELSSAAKRGGAVAAVEKDELFPVLSSVISEACGRHVRVWPERDTETTRSPSIAVFAER